MIKPVIKTLSDGSTAYQVKSISTLAPAKEPGLIAMGKTHVLKDPPWTFHVKLNDWIITYPTGIRAVVGNDEFRATYGAELKEQKTSDESNG